MIDLNDVLLAMSNIPVDDPIAEIWGRGLQGGYKIIEYTGSLPITIRANGDALLDYRIYGADGGVGEPTESGEPAGYKLPMTVGKNLYNPKNDTQGYYINSEGNIVKWVSDINYVSDKIPVSPEKKYTLYYPLTTKGTVIFCAFYNDSDRPQRVISIESATPPYEKIYHLVAPNNATYFRTSIKRNPDSKPITLFAENVYDVPVYIGENQLDSVEGVSDYVDKSSGKIVRMIGEYAFTGDESFNKYGNSDVFYTSTTIDPVGITTVNTITMRCNHPAFTAIENKDTRYWLNSEADDICCFLPGGRSQVFLRSTSNFTTATECKAYLKTQYDNGTPVKISYWLKTPIEEAPPVPFPEIPTIDGKTVIDYDGTPKPSQMYVKYKGKG